MECLFIKYMMEKKEVLSEITMAFLVDGKFHPFSYNTAFEVH